MPLPPLAPAGRARTKIVATVGPASRDPVMLRRLVDAGADVFRLNFSHGSHDEHSATFHALRRIAEETGRVVGVLQDLGGPKIRLGDLPGGELECLLGATFFLVATCPTLAPNELTCTYEAILEDLRPGETILFADGNVAMRVVNVGHGRAELVVTLPGLLRSRQGINLPGTDLKVQALTAKDLLDLDWTARHEVDYVALSFARSAEDVLWLKRELAARGSAAKVVVKVEKPQAVACFDEILAVTDAVMVARGDLGVEMDVAQVPAIQKKIIDACHRARVPVITATQMLNSMEFSSRPTRAEASDVFNAVLDGTDALMLSGESAVGAYPVEAVATMDRIAAEAEKLLTSGRPDPGPLTRSDWITPTTEVIVEAAALACRRLKASLLVVATHSGRTALALSKQPHATCLLALTTSAATARAMTLYWGVTPLIVPDISDVVQDLDLASAWAVNAGIAQHGGHVVLLRGTVPGNPVHNALVVHEVR